MKRCWRKFCSIIDRWINRQDLIGFDISKPSPCAIHQSSCIVVGLIHKSSSFVGSTASKSAMFTLPVPGIVSMLHDPEPLVC